MKFIEELRKFNINQFQCERYIKFVKSCERKNLITGEYVIKHHILPQSIFPEYKNLHLYPENKCLLTPRQHAICHKMLTKCFNSGKPKFSMIKAYKRIFDFSPTHTERYFSTREYEIALKLHSQIMSENNPMYNLETKEKAKRNRKPLTDIQRKEMSERRTGVDNISAEGKKRLSELWIGVPRPKTESQILNNRIANQKYWVHTPYGKFISVNEAAKISGHSHKTITKRCRNADVVIKPQIRLEPEFFGKTWREIGYYFEEL